MRDKAFQFTETLTKRLEYIRLHHTQFRSSLTRLYVMRFTLTIIVIVTIIKNKHLLSDEIFMETFQDGEFLMKCRKYQ